MPTFPNANETFVTIIKVTFYSKEKHLILPHIFFVNKFTGNVNLVFVGQTEKFTIDCHLF